MNISFLLWNILTLADECHKSAALSLYCIVYETVSVFCIYCIMVLLAIYCTFVCVI